MEDLNKVLYDSDKNIFLCEKKDVDDYYREKRSSIPLLDRMVTSKTTPRITIMAGYTNYLFINLSRILKDLENELNNISLYFVNNGLKNQYLVFTYNRIDKIDKREESTGRVSTSFINYFSINLAMCKDKNSRFRFEIYHDNLFDNKQILIKNDIAERPLMRSLAELIVKKLVLCPHYFAFTDMKDMLNVFTNVEKQLMRKHKDLYQASKLNLL